MPSSSSAANASDSSSAAVPPPSRFLAPGFRFHPTDEELVVYYLKRKICRRPLLLDAISEVEVYKHDPWDFPALSRIQTRDAQWYFFTRLDRKLSRRPRTNRGTPAGFWKTTGKDRPVLRGTTSIVVGFKKTLVFHTGRTPRGERSNWVMHEFRLEDEALARAGIPQDGYVVCRIFQKSGAGPQIGEQYGAPYIEEEWEEADELVPRREGGDERPNAEDSEYMQLIDIEQCMQLVDVEPEADPNIFTGTEGNAGMADQLGTLPNEDDGFVQLDDIAQPQTIGVNYSYIEDSVQRPHGMCNDQKSVTEAGRSSNFHDLDVEEFFDTVNGSAYQPNQYQMCLSAASGIYLHLCDLPNYGVGDYLTGQTTEDGAFHDEFHDALSHDIPTVQESHAQKSSQSMDNSCEFDTIDALMGYLEATNDNLHYSTLETSESLDQLNLPQECSLANVGSGMHSVAEVPEADNGSSAKMDRITGTQDSQREDQKSRPFTKHLVNMLGSIPSPPAFASEFPPEVMESVRRYSGNLSTSSNHVTAEIIQISKQGSLQKRREKGFLLSCGVRGNYTVSKSVKSTRKMDCSMLTMVFRSGLFLFVSAMVLTASFKVGFYLI